MHAMADDQNICLSFALHKKKLTHISVILFCKTNCLKSLQWSLWKLICTKMFCFGQQDLVYHTIQMIVDKI